MRTWATNSTAPPHRHASGHTPAPSVPRTPVVTTQRRLLQRSCACGGSCPTCQDEDKKIQMKLVAGKSGDPFEQEADRAADRVMGDPSPGSAAPRLQRAAASTQVAEVPAEIEGRIDSQRGRGEPLPDHLAVLMEQRLGYHFGGVRVHHDAPAAELARSVQARAFTTGSDIFFDAGQFAPESGAGRRLIAHELAHTVQQASSPASSLQRQTYTPAQLGSIKGFAGLPEEFVSLWLIPGQCDPTRFLTLNDFVVNNKLPRGKAGRTDVDFVPTTIFGVAGFKATFLSTSSMRSDQKDPKTVLCDPLVAKCKDDLAKGSTSFRINQTPTCAASPTVSGVATNAAQCDTVVGANCLTAGTTEANRVLAHEQLHFNIACVVVAKANLALWRGNPGIDRKAIVKAFNLVTTDYDTETGNGCDAAKQADWVNKVGKQFLPSVTF